MDCRDAVDALVDRLAGELSAGESAALDRHLAVCSACRAEAARFGAAWETLGEDPEVTPSHDFARDTLALLRRETLNRKIRAFPLRRIEPARLRWGQVAAVLAIGVAAGWSIARTPGTGPRPGTVLPTEARLALEPERTVDVSKVTPDLGKGVRLSNVAYTTADPAGRIGVTFDVTTRYTLVGRPEEKGIADVLARLVSGAGDTEGARGQAIDLVSQHMADAPPSPAIVKVLVGTLTTDRNPGVRKKAAEALVKLPSTPEIRDAFVAALRSDTNPAIRILAVEGLGKAATSLKDPGTIETLREKASDQKENGYIRGQAAQALTKVNL